MTTVADKALAFALAQRGKPYRWGAQGPNAYDCSGLVLASYTAAGLPLADTTANGILSNYCDPVTLGNTRPGDVIQPHAGHIFIVAQAGGGVIVEAPKTGLDVREVPRWGGLYRIGRLRGSQTVTDPAPVSSHPTIRRGDTGPTVKLLQNRLGITADGSFGPITEAHVKAYQRTHGLVADGIVGPKTWKSLNV